MNRLSRLFLLVTLLSCGITLSALEMKQGKVKLVMHENTGRFSAYYLTDVQRNRYSAFFFDDDPRTSVFSVLVDNQVYRLGESFEFTQTLEKTSNGAAFIWKSGFLEVRKEIYFATSTGQALADGYGITVTLKNTSENSINLGLRYLLDTYLGETDNTHFSTSSQSAFQNETDYSGSFPEYWVSSPKSKTPLALQCMLKTPGVTIPDRVIMANWKRLNDSSWNFESRSSRNFNLLPYSVNDSAVGIYFNPVSLPSGETRTINMVFGNFTEKGFSLAEKAEEELSELYTKAVISEMSSSDPVESARTDLLTIKDLLSRIDVLITSGKDIPQEQIDALANIVVSMEDRKKAHEERK
ncbi:MAG: hypothetical protein JW760_06500 [Spirochaetales bacterium]|nr:hypothetical protein [Spirochaetales bacterium]